MYFTEVRKARRTLAVALLIAPMVIALSLAFLLVGDLLRAPNLACLSFQILAGLALHMAFERFGYQPKPLPEGLSRKKATERAIQDEQASTILLRFTLAEAILMVSLVSVFVLPNALGWLDYVTGALVSMALMYKHVYPHREVIARVQAALDAEGGRSYLLEAYGFEPWSGTDADKPFHHASANNIANAREANDPDRTMTTVPASDAGSEESQSSRHCATCTCQ